MRFHITYFFILFSILSFSQEPFYVTVIKGSGKTKDGQSIQLGSKLYLTDKIHLATKESMLILLNPNLGRVVVTANNAKPNKENQFTLLIKDYLKVESKSVRLSVNSIHIPNENIANSLKPDSSINKKVLIIDTLRIRIPAYMNLKPDSTDCFFYLKLFGSDSTRWHRLMADSEYLLITQKDLFFQGDPNSGLPTKQTLFLYNRNALDYKYLKNIVTFEPVFITREACVSFIESIRKVMPEATEYSLLSEVRMQLYYTYGMPDARAIKKVYNSLR